MGPVMLYYYCQDRLSNSNKVLKVDIEFIHVQNKEAHERGNGKGRSKM